MSRTVPAEVIKGYFKFMLSANVFTVSAVGVTKVRFPKVGSWGEFVTLDLTGRSFTLNDAGHASAQFLGLFGSTASVAWANACPWQVCLINKDNDKATVRMALTRDWSASFNKVTDTANYIGDNGTAPVTSDYKNWIICDNITPSDWVDLPSVAIGCVQATKDASAGGVWDIAALSSQTGYGKYNENVPFLFPAGQCGNANLKFFANNGGTAPAGTTQSAYYSICGGICRYTLQVYGGNLGGSGAFELKAYLPIPSMSSLNQSVGAGYFMYAAGSVFAVTMIQATAFLYAYPYNSVTVVNTGDLDQIGDQYFAGVAYPI